MASLVSQAIGVVAVLLGVAWMVRPTTMIKLQFRVLYFWAEPPNVEELNQTVARVGGLILAASGAALAVGILP